MVVDPQYLMCRPHWTRVPKSLADTVWSTYRHGQEVDKRPSREYLTAAKAAIVYIAVLERPKELV